METKKREPKGVAPRGTPFLSHYSREEEEGRGRGGEGEGGEGEGGRGRRGRRRDSLSHSRIFLSSSGGVPERCGGDPVTHADPPTRRPSQDPPPPRPGVSPWCLSRHGFS